MNTFSWSKSRHERYSECQRAYFFQYYASWGGWDSDAAPLARELYTLKKLSNRFTWGGSVVHAAIRGVLMSIRAGRTFDEARVIERAHEAMREDFKFSRDKAYWRSKGRKDFTGLVEHEYAEPVSSDEWKRGWANVEQALQGFFASKWVGLARSLSAKQWLEVDVMDFDQSFFELDGVRVFAVPDFAYREEDGRAVVVDWKTGEPREGYDDQILGYALYLQARHGVPLEGMRASLVYLNQGVEKDVVIEEAALGAFRDRFRESVSGMRALLRNPETNEPKPREAFPETPKAEVCARCVFRRPCGKVP